MASSNSKTREEELAATKAAAMNAYEKLLEAKEHFKSAAEAAGVDVKDGAIEQFLKGRAKTEALGEQASVYIRQKPLATLGIAFATGYVLSQLFSRK